MSTCRRIGRAARAAATHRDALGYTLLALLCALALGWVALDTMAAVREGLS